MKLGKKEVEKTEEAVEEVETEISPWRLGIALVLIMIFGGVLVWGTAQLLDKTLQKGKQVLGAQQPEVSSNVALPSQKEVHDYINNWQSHLKPEDLQKFVASNSAVGKWVQKLEDIQANDKGVIDVICSIVCHSF
jgi:hypothetical protein